MMNSNRLKEWITFMRTTAPTASKQVKNIKICYVQSKINIFKFVNEAIDLSSLVHWNSSWVCCRHVILCIVSLSKFPSAKIYPSSCLFLMSSAKTLIDFLTDLKQSHIFHLSIRVGHASCFTGSKLKLFWDSTKINIIFCTVAERKIRSYN